MTAKNRYARRSKISEAKFRELVKLFALELEATQIAELANLNRNTVNRFLKAIRERLAEHSEQQSPFAGEVEVDLTRRLVWRHGELVSLTRTEWLLLQHLAANAGKVIVNAELLSKVWGPEYGEETHYLRLYITYLRQKIEEDPANPKYILTERGIGYRFEG